MLTRIDATGGTLVAIETGYIQQQIQDAAYRAQQAIDAGEAVVVGINRFVQRDKGATGRNSAAFPLHPELERQQIDRVRTLRAGRSRQEWRGTLARVEQAARDGSNLVPRSSRPWKHTPRSARSPTRSGGSSESIRAFGRRNG